MPRFAKELPPYTEKYKTATTITPGDAAQLHTDISRMGDRYLASTYTELPTFAKHSVLADMLEDEILDRFCEQNMMVPDMVVVDG